MAKFVRKNLDPTGSYTLAYKRGTDEFGQPKITETVRIAGRDVFETDDKKLIEILKNDPEIIEFNKKTQIEANEEE